MGTANGSATSPADYAATGGITFLSGGSLSQTVSTTTAADTVRANGWRISPPWPVNGTVATPTTAGTILDDSAADHGHR
jgi:hypothetical protein